jgi:hypothetical protein
VLKELPEEGPSFGEGDMIREESSLWSVYHWDEVVFVIMNWEVDSAISC